MSTLSRPAPAPESAPLVDAVADVLPDSPRRRFLDNAEERRNQTPTLVGRGSHCVGQLHCLGDLSVAGSGEGEADVAGVFILSDHAQWHGTVRCQQAVLAGQFDGQLYVAGKTEVRATAQIRGELHAKQLAIAAGAIIAADIIMTDCASIERYTEKRAR